MAIAEAGTRARAREPAAWQVVAAGMLALAVAMGIGRFAFTPILPAMRDAFTLSPGDLGALASANYLGYLIGAIAAAAPIPNRVQGWLLHGSLISVVIVTALMAATELTPAWLALRFLAGLASAGVFVFGSTAVLGWLNQRGRLDLTGWFFSGVGVGIAASGLAILAVQRLSSGGVTWRAEWIAVAALAAALLAPVWAWLPRVAPTRGDARPIARDRSPGGVSFPIVLLGAAYFMDGAGYIVAGTFLVAIVAAIPGLAGLGAASWILVGLAGAPSALLWSRLGGRIGLVATLGLAYVLQAVSLALPALSASPAAAALSAVLFGGTFIGITLLTIAEARRRVPPHLVARTIGLLTAVFGLGQVIGPLLAARIAEQSGDYRPALLIASGAVLLGALLTFIAGALPDGARPDGGGVSRQE